MSSPADVGTAPVSRFPKRPALTITALPVLATVAFSCLLTVAVAIAISDFPLQLLSFLLSKDQFVLPAIMLAIAGVSFGGLLLWSLVPYRQPRRQPGVALDLSRHPQLRD